MRIKPFASLACTLTAGALVLPACGGDESASEPTAKSAPADELRVLEQRVGGLERQLRDLRQEIKSQGDDEQSGPGDGPGDDTGTGDAADQGGASAPQPAGGGTRGASDSGSGGASGPGSGGPGSGGSGSGGSGSGGGDSPSRGGGGSHAGGGPDPGTSEDDSSLEEICGPNPAPEC